ncbi:CinA family protein [Campylobacter peloridis]|uniref:CinA family protein n=1 Tax=Campylobacter peloridis TaxID=488546 RepID=A0ABX6TUQ5_9BACT|nr:CinA family protein [Campylobacter peloridis]AJC85085.1 competence/damage-inducible domain protein [Campylobacter peloridis LMG 23910]QOQ89116.1 CinA family protein [Campylobacter peloridis]
MKHLIIIIGNELIVNENYMRYIHEEYKKRFLELHELKFINKPDKDLPFLLEKLSLEYTYITIFSINEYYATIAKIIATLNDDVLVLENETLVPSKSIYTKNSFVSEFEQCHINLLNVSINLKLPQILNKPEINYTYFCLLDIDEMSANILLDTLTKSFEIQTSSSALLENLICIRASATQYGKLEGFLKGVFKLFEGKVFLDNNPIKFITKKLLDKNLKISFAESCTGGLCASKLTEISGVSSIFEGSLITYSNRLKNSWLGVSNDTLESVSEYSDRCIYFMLKGVFKTTNCDFALAISGVAGEDDDKNTKAGTIYIGAMYKDGTFLQECIHIQGARNYIREQACLAAYSLMLRLKPEIFFGI